MFMQAGINIIIKLNFEMGLQINIYFDFDLDHIK